MLEPERSPLDGGSRDPCHLEGGGLRATLRQWQGPARALPGGGGGGAPRRACLGRGVGDHSGGHQRWGGVLGWLSAVVGRTRHLGDGTGRPPCPTAVVTPIPPPPIFAHPPRLRARPTRPLLHPTDHALRPHRSCFPSHSPLLPVRMRSARAGRYLARRHLHLSPPPLGARLAPSSCAISLGTGAACIGRLPPPPLLPLDAGLHAPVVFPIRFLRPTGSGRRRPCSRYGRRGGGVFGHCDLAG